MERRKDLDFAKGIGIILMVLGHCYSEGNGEGIRLWFYSFHMPLFFIIPGLITRERAALPPFRTFLKKRIQGLMIPYYLWGFAAACFLTVMGRHSIVWMLGAVKRVLILEGLSAMWFLPCLLFAEILFYGCMQIGRKKVWCGHIAAAVLMVGGFAIPSTDIYTTIILRSMTGASFIYLGWMMASLLNKHCPVYLWILLCVVQVVLAGINGRCDMLGRQYGNFLLFYLNAMLGTHLVIRLYHTLLELGCRLLTRILAWFGRNSLVLVCTSLYVIEILRLVDYKVFGNIFPALKEAEGLSLCFMTLAIEVIVIIFSEKYLWFLFGRQNRPSQVQSGT